MEHCINEIFGGVVDGVFYIVGIVATIFLSAVVVTGLLGVVGIGLLWLWNKFPWRNKEKK